MLKSVYILNKKLSILRNSILMQVVSQLRSATPLSCKRDLNYQIQTPRTSVNFLLFH